MDDLKLKCRPVNAKNWHWPALYMRFWVNELYSTETDMGTKFGISLTVKIELRYSSGPTPNRKRSFETPGELCCSGVPSSKCSSSIHRFSFSYLSWEALAPPPIIQKCWRSRKVAGFKAFASFSGCKKTYRSMVGVQEVEMAWKEFQPLISGLLSLCFGRLCFWS